MMTRRRAAGVPPGNDVRVSDIERLRPAARLPVRVRKTQQNKNLERGRAAICGGTGLCATVTFAGPREIVRPQLNLWPPGPTH
jgi:hypothetical protein